ncbi:hypothetical protein ACFV29_11735 [Streptomyces sp. NPDC059690]|uniref:hypothetical protein n=1 Tax=Streptomyces sp. NPDC059690 TaxID=3346907 RepID=UPI0036B42F6B
MRNPPGPPLRRVTVGVLAPGVFCAPARAANTAVGTRSYVDSDPRTPPSRQEPSYSNTWGYDSCVFDLGTAPRRGGDQLAFRLVSQRDAAGAGVLFRAVDATE